MKKAQKATMGLIHTIELSHSCARAGTDVYWSVEAREWSKDCSSKADDGRLVLSSEKLRALPLAPLSPPFNRKVDHLCGVWVGEPKRKRVWVAKYKRKHNAPQKLTLLHPT